VFEGVETAEGTIEGKIALYAAIQPVNLCYPPLRVGFISGEKGDI
jgi:hypothetical protein